MAQRQKDSVRVWTCLLVLVLACALDVAERARSWKREAPGSPFATDATWRVGALLSVWVLAGTEQTRDLCACVRACARVRICCLASENLCVSCSYACVRSLSLSRSRAPRTIDPHDAQLCSSDALLTVARWPGPRGHAALDAAQGSRPCASDMNADKARVEVCVIAVWQDLSAPAPWP